MVARVLLNSSGLKVSKPGIDVLSAGFSNLQFSSDWSAMTIVQRGVHSPAWSVSGLYGTYNSSIAFVKTFSTVPFVLFYQILPSGARTQIGSGPTFIFQFDRNETATPTLDSRFGASAKVFTDRIDLNYVYRKRTSGVPTPVFNIEYIVFDNNL